ISALNTAMTGYVQEYIKDNIEGSFGQLQGFLGLNQGDINPWEADIVVTSLAEVAGMGIPQASAQAIQMMTWMNNFVSGVFTNGPNGFNPINGAPYYLYIYDQSGNPITTWSQFYSVNV